MKTAEVEPCGPSPRTDADVARDVATGLRWCSAEPSAAIQVAVEGGWVTLSGCVQSPRHRQAAADSLRYLLGVTGVSNRLTVEAQGAERLTAPAAFERPLASSAT